MKCRYNRFFAIVLSASILLSNFGGLELQAASKIGGENQGSGGVEGTLRDIFSVVVPTENSPVTGDAQGDSLFNFILDPRKLAQSGSGSLAGKKIEPGATVYFMNSEPDTVYDYSSTSDAYEVINKSTIDIDIKLSVEVSSLGDVKLTPDKTFKNDSSPSVYLALKDDKKASGMDRYGTVLKSVLQGCPDAYKVVYDFDKGMYRYELKDGFTQFPRYEFRMTGACNTGNSWLNVGKDFNASLVVTWSVAARPKNKAPIIEKRQYAMEMWRPVLVDVDLGAGDLAAAGVQSVTYTDSGTNKTLSSDYYTFVDGTLRFKAALINSLIEDGIHSRAFRVNFNDKAKTSSVVTLDTEDKAPSISVTEYAMASGQPVLIDVDLGSGVLAATGIKAVTFVDASGNTATLDAGNYIYENGALKLKSSYIDKVLGNGRTVRDLKVVFNDKARTTVALTLKIDGSLPSVLAKEFVMIRDQALEIEVNPGSGDLGATDIKSITFANASGGTTTLSAENYTYENGTNADGTPRGILTLKASYINQMLNNGRTQRDLTIIFNNSLGTKETIMLIAENKAPKISEGEYSMSLNNPVLVPVDLGAGESGASGIKAVTFFNLGRTVTLSTDKYKYYVDEQQGGTLKFFGSYINQMLGNGNSSREFTVILDDKANTTGKVTLRIMGTEPSIAQTEYEMKPDTDVEVKVDLGDGDLAAAGVKTVTFANSSGGFTTLDNSKYIYSNGVLTIKADYINQMIKNGRVSRDLTITFDNAISTAQTIMLKAVGKEPSIVSGNTYKMTSGTPVEIELDLGTEAFAATGIESITYKNASGITIFVGTDKYKFADGKVKLFSSYITQMINNKVTSREFTITFNNLIQTKAKVKLSK